MHINPFEHFIRFVECERSLSLLENDIKKLSAELSDLTQQKQDVGTQWEAFKNTITLVQRQMHAYELDAKTLRERENSIKRKMENIGSPKEYAALQKELVDIEKSQNACEDVLLEKLQLYEKLQIQVPAKEKEYIALNDHLYALVQEKNAAKQKLETRRAELREQCENLSKLVPGDKLDLYNQMKTSFADPVVPVRENFCTACGWQVPTKDVGQLKKNLLISCKSCYRILYVP